VPLIALSSHAEEGDIHAGREAGFDDYLAKSDQTRLTENLARALRQAGRGEAQETLRRAS
jgi:CheY-like chemotaxis protein